MKRNLLLSVIIIFGSSTSFQSLAKDNSFTAEELDKIFYAKADSSGNNNILFRECIIHPEVQDSSRLVIYLHGGSGKGNDNVSQLKSPAISEIYDYLKSDSINTHFILPQCPESESWGGKDPYVRKLMTFIKKYVCDHKGLLNAPVYIMGASMGATGVWELLAENPDYFEAAMVASGTYRGSGLNSFKNSRIVCTFGTEERSYNNCLRLIESLTTIGTEITFVPLEGKSHIEACDSAFFEKNLQLLFTN